MTKLEPCLGFAEYQVAMANYSASIALKSRLANKPLPAPATTAIAAPARPALADVKKRELFNHPRRSAASALVRKFRS